MARRNVRPLLAAVAVLLALALWLPLWSTRMEAPQYHGEEALTVYVYAGRVTGPLKEIATLNQYAGVRLPLDTPELSAAPAVVVVLLVLALAAFLFHGVARRRTAVALLALMALTVVAGGALLQYRLYEMGHVRGHSALARMHDFTPPLIGSVKVANFHARMRLGSGAWAFLAAMVLTGWAVVEVRRGDGDGRRRKVACDPQETTAEARDTTAEGQAAALDRCDERVRTHG
jgi:hypothetical protein